jgi:hypothetical protein
VNERFCPFDRFRELIYGPQSCVLVELPANRKFAQSGITDAESVGRVRHHATILVVVWGNAERNPDGRDDS